jgi:hypothetical protein
MSQALDWAQKAIDAARSAGDSNAEIQGHALLAGIKMGCGEVGEARAVAQEALRRSFSDHGNIAKAFLIENLAAVAALWGDARKAARLRGYVHSWLLHEAHGVCRSKAEQRTYDILNAELERMLSSNEIEALGAEGARWTDNEAVAEALAISADAIP